MADSWHAPGMLTKTPLIAGLLIAWISPVPPAGEKATKDAAADRFVLGGAAEAVDGRCIRLTPDAPWLSGSAWSSTPLDLDAPFDLEMALTFGDKDDSGADGIVFALTPSPRTGWRGEGIGFAGMGTSLGIELDTYQNHRENDPSADHLALVVNGSVRHAAGDVVELPNLEDGRPHEFRVRWSPEEDTLEVFLDGELRATYPGSIVQDVFGATKTVFWGLTAGTGRKSNQHDVCFPK